MKIVSRTKAQGLIVIGMAALAAMGLFLRTHFDFGAGVGLGISLPTLAVGLFSLRNPGPA